MRIVQKLITNPALCSLVVAFIGSLTAIIVAVMGAMYSKNIAKVSMKEERKRLIGFHKLEVYENAIEEINYLVPLYRLLSNEAYEKRDPKDIHDALPELNKTIRTILEYQRNHNALGKAKVYSKALEEYVPFSANPACVKYVNMLEMLEQNFKKRSKNNRQCGGPADMYLVDELSKYEECANRLKEEIEALEFFEQ